MTRWFNPYRIWWFLGPCAVLPRTGRIANVSRIQPEDYPLRREILSAVRRKCMRVAIDSDRACYILGETWRGVAKGCRNAIFLAVGTGIGAGILIDGQVLRGAHDIAGAIGWASLLRPVPQPDPSTAQGPGCPGPLIQPGGGPGQILRRVEVEKAAALRIQLEHGLRGNDFRTADRQEPGGAAIAF